MSSRCAVGYVTYAIRSARWRLKSRWTELGRQQLRGVKDPQGALHTRGSRSGHLDRINIPSTISCFRRPIATFGHCSLDEASFDLARNRGDLSVTSYHIRILYTSNLSAASNEDIQERDKPLISAPSKSQEASSDQSCRSKPARQP